MKTANFSDIRKIHSLKIFQRQTEILTPSGEKKKEDRVFIAAWVHVPAVSAFASQWTKVL